MKEQTIASPWRDGTLEGELSADMFDKVVTRLLHDAPDSTQAVKDNGAPWYIDSVVDSLQMQKQHIGYLLWALGDDITLDFVERLAERVRVVCEPLRVAA